MVNLLILRTSLNVGGIEQTILSCLKLLDRSLFRVHLVAFTQDGLLLPVAKAYADGYAFLPRRTDPDLRLIVSLRRYVIKNNIDIVHSNNLAEMTYAFLAFLPMRVQKVGWVHRIPAWHRAGWHRWMLKRQDCAVFVSDSLRAEMMARGWAAPRVETIKNGVEWGMSPCQGANSKKKKTFIVCMIARFCMEKDHATLIRALAYLKGPINGKQVRAVLVGGGDAGLIERTKTLAVGMGVQHRVRFVGGLPDVSASLAEADCLVAPSTLESFSLTVVEAMAAGVPVVASDIPAHREITTDGRYGVLFRVGDASDLAKKLTLVITDDAVRERLRVSGWVRARDYDIRKTIQSMQTLYLSLSSRAGNICSH